MLCGAARPGRAGQGRAGQGRAGWILRAKPCGNPPFQGFGEGPIGGIPGGIIPGSGTPKGAGPMGPMGPMGLQLLISGQVLDHVGSASPKTQGDSYKTQGASYIVRVGIPSPPDSWHKD